MALGAARGIIHMRSPCTLQVLSSVKKMQGWGKGAGMWLHVFTFNFILERCCITLWWARARNKLHLKCPHVGDSHADNAAIHTTGLYGYTGIYRPSFTLKPWASRESLVMPGAFPKQISLPYILRSHLSCAIVRLLILHQKAVALRAAKNKEVKKKKGIKILAWSHTLSSCAKFPFCSHSLSCHAEVWQ